MHNDVDIRLLFWLGFLCWSGIYGFFWGFKRQRRCRLIENIPTSTVRGMAMGLVELYGRALQRTALQSPLNKVDCVYYKYCVEKYVRSGKSGHWQKISSGDSSHVPFSLEDDTGRTTVDPSRAELFIARDFCFETGLGRSIPPTIVEFMDGRGLAYRTIFGNHQLRFQEWVVRPQEYVYVLGSAQKSNSFAQDHAHKLVARLEQIKSDQQRMKAIDANADGTVSMEEWDNAVDDVERQLIEEELKNAAAAQLDDCFVGKGEDEEVFILSDKSQKDLIFCLRWQAALGVFGGPFLALGSLVFLLKYVGILN